jgi:hypothetical protein
MMGEEAREIQRAKMKLRWATDKKYRKMMKRRNAKRGKVYEEEPSPFPPGVLGVCDMFQQGWVPPDDAIRYEEPEPAVHSWMDELLESMTSKNSE